MILSSAAWIGLKAIETHTGQSLTADTPPIASAVTAARLLESDPRLMAASAHFLAFGRP